MSLGVIEGSELRGRLVETGVGSKDTATTLSLIANNSTHGDGVGRELVVEEGCVSGLENYQCAAASLKRAKTLTRDHRRRLHFSLRLCFQRPKTLPEERNFNHQHQSLDRL